MRGIVWAAFAAAVLATGFGATTADAQGHAPRTEEAIAQTAQTETATPPADPDTVNAPERLRGRSIIVNYVETRTSRPEGGGPATARKVHFQLIVYISTEKRAFNRLSPGRSGHSDQVRGAKDLKGSTASRDLSGFATRDVVFDGLKMTVTNTFGGRGQGGTGKREISAVFDESYTKCVANVVTTIDGEYARRRLMTGGFEEVLSAKNDSFACTVHDGNALIGKS
jgi:hypothetical protein